MPARRSTTRMIVPEVIRNVHRETGGACLSTNHPCAESACRYHAACQTTAESLEIMRGDRCALRLAARGPLTLEEIGRSLGITRERVRQIESLGIRRMGRRMLRCGYLDPTQFSPESLTRAMLVGTSKQGRKMPSAELASQIEFALLRMRK